MSEATTSPAPEQAQPVPPPPADTTTPDTVPAPEQEQAPDTTLAECNRTLRRFGTLCRDQADMCYRMAETAAEYVRQFLGASADATRSSAVGRLAAEWMQWDEESMSQPVARATTRLKERVNVLLRVNAVRALMGDGRDVAKGDGTAKGRGKGTKGNPVPWGKLRELTPLVDRDPADNCEVWSPLSDAVRAAGQDLVQEMAASGLVREDVVKKVRVILATHWTAQAEELRAKAAANPTDKDAAWAADRAAKEAAKWVDKVAAEEEAPAVQGKGEGTAEQEQAPEQEARPEPQPRAVPLTQMAKEGTAKDVAEMCRELVESNDDPDTVLRALLSALKGTNVLSKKSLRAVNAALVMLHREEAPVAPTVNGLVPQDCNGHAAAVA